MQAVFADADSPWAIPCFAMAAQGVAALLPCFPGRTVFTRFIPPSTVMGSWVAYYAKWPFAAAAPPTHAVWSVAAPFQPEITLDTHQFSKWTPRMRALAGPAATIVVCGVSTDCCVLATALAAIEDGTHVRIVADACRAKTPALHAAALDLLRLRAPQVAITTVAEERGRYDRHRHADS